MNVLLIAVPEADFRYISLQSKTPSANKYPDLQDSKKQRLVIFLLKCVFIYEKRQTLKGRVIILFSFLSLFLNLYLVIIVRLDIKYAKDDILFFSTSAAAALFQV